MRQKFLLKPLFRSTLLVMFVMLVVLIMLVLLVLEGTGKSTFRIQLSHPIVSTRQLGYMESGVLQMQLRYLILTSWQLGYMHGILHMQMANGIRGEWGTPNAAQISNYKVLATRIHARDTPNANGKWVT